jgi:uncharacterized protein YceK
MKALMATIVLTAALLSGCSTVGTGASAITTEQALCEQPRGGGVWAAAAGACIRGGGAM